MLFLGSLFFAGALEAAEWAKTYGGAGADSLSSMQPTADGGYIVAGSTTSFGAGGSDAWLMKLAADGSIVWQKTYGGIESDGARSVYPTLDGGFVMAGTTQSFGAGRNDLWVLKLDSNGNVAWQKTYGGTGDEAGIDVKPTADGGYIAIGNGLSPWILKLDAVGSIAWQQYFDFLSPGTRRVFSVQQAADGGYMLVGGGFPRPQNGFGWLAKLDASGNVAWLRLYRTAIYTRANHLQPTADGGYIMVGESGGELCAQGWVTKLDASGNALWTRVYDGMRSAGFVQELAGGGFVVSGNDWGCGSFQFYKAVVMRLDRDGNVIWKNAYGGDSFQSGLSARATSDGGFIAAGFTDSLGSGDLDAWVLKLDARGLITGCAGVTPLSATSSSAVSDVQNEVPIPTASSVTPASNNASVRESTAATLQQCYFVPPTEPPACTMSASTTTPRVGNTLLLTAGCTNSPTRYAWNGCASTGPVCSDTQSVPGTRAYAVTATNAIGTSAPVSITVTWLAALPAAATEIPTLSKWSLLIVSGALGICAVAMSRRSRSGGAHRCGAASDRQRKRTH